MTCVLLFDHIKQKLCLEQLNNLHNYHICNNFNYFYLFFQQPSFVQYVVHVQHNNVKVTAMAATEINLTNLWFIFITVTTYSVNSSIISWSSIFSSFTSRANCVCTASTIYTFTKPNKIQLTKSKQLHLTSSLCRKCLLKPYCMLPRISQQPFQLQRETLLSNQIISYHIISGICSAPITKRLMTAITSSFQSQLVFIYLLIQLSTTDNNRRFMAIIQVKLR